MSHVNKTLFRSFASGSDAIFGQPITGKLTFGSMVKFISAAAVGDVENLKEFSMNSTEILNCCSVRCRNVHAFIRAPTV